MDLPSDDALRWIVRTYARLLAGHADAIGSPQLVQPTGEFFPDEFRPDGPSLGRLLRRMLGYAPVSDDIAVELALSPEEDTAGGACASGSCGSDARASTRGARGARGARGVEELADGYRVFLGPADMAEPDRLTASFARSLGGIVLLEAGEEVAGSQVLPTAEIVATACGFGVLLANGAAVWGKSCGGLRMSQHTVLSVEEVCVALALFVALHGVKTPLARGKLGATQREAFDLAVAWTESNPFVVDALRHAPALLEGGTFRLEPLRGLLGRWLQKRRFTKEMRPPAVSAARPRSKEQERRLEEIRALVDEVIGDP